MANIHQFSGAIKVGALASDPAGVANGTIYYNTTDGVFRTYQGGSWSSMAPSEVLDTIFRITDDGDPSKKIAFQASGISASTTRTLTMPDANVDLGNLTNSNIAAAAGILESKLALDFSTSSLNTAIGGKISSTEKGAANGVATLDSNSLIPTAQLPPLAITEVFVVANTAARLALTAQMGDVAIQTDNSLTYILSTNSPSTDADWKQITAAGAVTTVNGQTGTVLLDSDDISEGITNLYFTEARVRGTVLTGFSAASGGTVSATDSVLSAFGKLENRVALDDAKVSYDAATARSDLIASSIVDGDTTHAPDGNSVFDALALKLANVVEDTTPQLGGDLDLNSKVVLGNFQRAAVASASSFIEEEYLHSISLSASQTDTVLSSLSFAHASFEGQEVVYKIKEATSNAVRIGRLRIASNGTDIVVVDDYAETADVGVTWSAVINGASVDVRYSSTANAKTMRADVKRIKA